MALSRYGGERKFWRMWHFLEGLKELMVCGATAEGTETIKCGSRKILKQEIDGERTH